MPSVAVLTFTGAQALDIVGPMEVFSEASLFADFAGIESANHYDLVYIAPGEGNPKMSNGMLINASQFSSLVPEFDTLIIPGGDEASMRALAERPEFMQWLSSAVANSRRIVSVCTGAFILASLGVLDGRRVCTHWGACDRLQDFAPAVVVDADALFQRDGRFYTSAGVTSGIDLALALVEEDLGSSIASAIARNLVLYLRRPGGQSQFKQPLQQQHNAGNKMREVIDYITGNLDSALSIDDLANEAAMSPRSFSRLFKQELGTSPAAFIREQRLTVACSLLCEGDNSLKQIARSTGFSSTAVFSNAFKRKFGLSPEDYRVRFKTAIGE